MNIGKLLGERNQDIIRVLHNLDNLQITFITTIGWKLDGGNIFNCHNTLEWFLNSVHRIRNNDCHFNYNRWKGLYCNCYEPFNNIHVYCYISDITGYFMIQAVQRHIYDKWDACHLSENSNHFTAFGDSVNPHRYALPESLKLRALDSIH